MNELPFPTDGTFPSPVRACSGVASFCNRVDVWIEWFAETTIITMLTISGAVMGDAKQPATNVRLRPARGQVPVQAKKSVLHDILRFVSREPETYQISQQRFAQFAIQSGSLARVSRKAREWQRQW